MTEAPYRLILFDVDDTLMDFRASETHAMGLCWKRFFAEVVELDTFFEVFRKLNLQIWKEVENGKLKPPQLSDDRARRTLRQFGLNTRHAPELGQLFAAGLAEVARWLPGAEHGFISIASRYRVGLITNGLSCVQNPRIDALGIRSHVSALQISEEAGTMKPRREIFARALEQANCSKEETLMVGDSVSSDFQGARNAGLDFCWVKPDDHGLPLGFPKPRYHVHSLMELDELLP